MAPDATLSVDASTGSATSFNDIAAVIRGSLAKLFPASSGVRVIAEPGRFFVEGAFVLCTNVISRRTTKPAVLTGRGGELELDGVASGARGFTTSSVVQQPAHTRYYINDGVYGSFNCVIYDHQVVRPVPLPTAVIDTGLEGFRRYMAAKEPALVQSAGPTGTNTVTEHLSGSDDACADGVPSSVWGQTCDGFDVVLPRVNLPALNIGDWLCFENMGAYTLAAGTEFNGFSKPHVMYVSDDGIVE
jgi:ornithine decarboxylase